MRDGRERGQWVGENTVENGVKEIIEGSILKKNQEGQVRPQSVSWIC